MPLSQWLTCWSCPSSSSTFCYSPLLSYNGRGSQIRSEEKATIKMSDGLFLPNSDEGRANWAQRQKIQSGLSWWEVGSAGHTGNIAMDAQSSGTPLLTAERGLFRGKEVIIPLKVWKLKDCWWQPAILSTLASLPLCDFFHCLEMLFLCLCIIHRGFLSRER